MINERSITAVDAARLDHGWVRPLYDTYNWSQIPATLQALLTGTGPGGLPADALGPIAPGSVRNLILLFVDAFGWKFFEAASARYPFLKRITDRGVVNKSTSMFPSTTTAHTALLYTGEVPIRSGFFEWFQYEPMVDNIVCPLMFNFAGEPYPDTLRHVGLDPAAFYGSNSTYRRLNSEHAIDVTTYLPAPLVGSAYSTHNMENGGRTFGYESLSEALVAIAEAASANRTGRALHTLYVGTIDTQMHSYGPSSAYVRAEIDAVLTQFERVLHAGLEEGHAAETVVMLIADHGQVDIDPGAVIWIDDLPGAERAVTPFLRTNRADRALIPAGSGRDLFMYVQEAHLDEVQAWLAARLEGRAQVVRTADFIADSMFGTGPVAQRFLDRVGNLLVLPYGEGITWWHGDQAPGYKLRGMHGGLHPAEMETPILLMPYG